MKLTAKTFRSSARVSSTSRLVQVMYTTGKYDYVREDQLKDLQAAKKIAYLV